MQYSEMVDLMKKAELAGVRETESVINTLEGIFTYWLNQQDLREITDEEVEALHTAFAEGFANFFKA